MPWVQQWKLRQSRGMVPRSCVGGSWYAFLDGFVFSRDDKSVKRTWRFCSGKKIYYLRWWYTFRMNLSIIHHVLLWLWYYIASYQQSTRTFTQPTFAATENDFRHWIHSFATLMSHTWSAPLIQFEIKQWGMSNLISTEPPFSNWRRSATTHQPWWQDSLWKMWQFFLPDSNHRLETMETSTKNNNSVVLAGVMAKTPPITRQKPRLPRGNSSLYLSAIQRKCWDVHPLPYCPSISFQKRFLPILQVQPTQFQFHRHHATIEMIIQILFHCLVYR